MNSKKNLNKRVYKYLKTKTLNPSTTNKQSFSVTFRVLPLSFLARRPAITNVIKEEFAIWDFILNV